ncbi:type II secretion system F family protein [Thermaurantiacus sp.]
MAPSAPPLATILLLSTAAGLALAGISMLRAHASPIARRARALGAAGRDGDPSPAAPMGDRFRGVFVALAAVALERVKLPASLLPNLGPALARAGHRTPHARVSFLMACLFLPPALAAVASLVVPHLFPQMSILSGLLAGAGLGAAAPFLWLKNATVHRQQAIRAGFPDMLDLFVICIEAGLSMDAAMARVARELAPALPELADELGLTAIELGFLPDRADAFANLQRRVPIDEVANLIALFQQTERYGTPLAAALRTEAAESRAAALLRVEERAARLPAILTVPMILFILPPLFIVLIGPVIVQLLAM